MIRLACGAPPADLIAASSFQFELHDKQIR
jgi:hypothetical protein